MTSYPHNIPLNTSAATTTNTTTSSSYLTTPSHLSTITSSDTPNSRNPSEQTPLSAPPSMRSAVMHQPTPPPSMQQPYPASASIGFSSMPETQHSTSSSFAQQPPQQHPLPNAISLHQPVASHPPAQQQAPHPSHPGQQPLRADIQQKIGAPPPQQQHQAIRRFPSQQRPAQQQMTLAKPGDHMTAPPQDTLLPQMNKVPHQQPNLHLIHQQGQQIPPQQRYPQMGPQGHLQQAARAKGEVLSSVPLPLHPDPIQPFQPAQDSTEGDRAFGFGRHGIFDDLPHDENPNPVGLPPPHAGPETEQGNTIPGADGLAGHIGMPAVPAISSLSLPGIAGPPGGMHGVGFGGPGGLGNAAIVGGASEIAEALVGDRKGLNVQRRMRPVPRTRNQQMTDAQRKQRHNEHTRASRSRIDKGLERLKNTIKKVRPHQKVTKKADVLQEAVKLLKEGFRLPLTESDEEREDTHPPPPPPPPQDSSLSV